MYVRITRFTPTEHWRGEVIETLDRYLEWLKGQPGFVSGMRLFPLHHHEEIARLTVWEARSFADHVATTEHSLAVRSQMLSMTQDLAIHEEEFDERPVYSDATTAAQEPPLHLKDSSRPLSRLEDEREEEIAHLTLEAGAET